MIAATKDTGYTLIRSKRKTVSLQITRDLQVVVRCPYRMEREQADRFVERHRVWIHKHMERLGKIAAERAAFDFSPGQAVYFHGQAYILAEKEGIGQAGINGGRLCLPAGVADRERAVMEFYRREAERRLPGLTALWAERMALEPPKVRVTAARSRWGSCSAAGSISYSLRMSCLPPDLEEYVIVHELCHLREHNHSPGFHALVERFLPEQKRLRAKLRDFQKKLLF